MSGAPCAASHCATSEPTAPVPPVSVCRLLLKLLVQLLLTTVLTQLSSVHLGSSQGFDAAVHAPPQHRLQLSRPAERQGMTAACSRETTISAGTFPFNLDSFEGQCAPVTRTRPPNAALSAALFAAADWCRAVRRGASHAPADRLWPCASAEGRDDTSAAWDLAAGKAADSSRTLKAVAGASAAATRNIAARARPPLRCFPAVAMGEGVVWDKTASPRLRSCSDAGLAAMRRCRVAACAAASLADAPTDPELDSTSCTKTARERVVTLRTP